MFPSFFKTFFMKCLYISSIAPLCVPAFFIIRCNQEIYLNSKSYQQYCSTKLLVSCSASIPYPVFATNPEIFYVWISCPSCLFVHMWQKKSILGSECGIYTVQHVFKTAL